MQKQSKVAQQRDLMNKMYRLQKYIYNATRKYYLLGRDRLIQRVLEQQPASILEVGCGTGRNLQQLAKALGSGSSTVLAGIDISEEMIDYARQHCDERIQFLAKAAEEFDHRQNMSLSTGFACIFYSYTLSIIPDWQSSLRQSLANLQPGGRVLIVDFYDLNGLPDWFQWLLRAWLRLFHVRANADIVTHIEEKFKDYRINKQVLYRGYCALIEIYAAN